MIVRLSPYPTVAEEGYESLLSFRYRAIPARPNSSLARRGNKGRAVCRPITSGSATNQVSPLVSISARPDASMFLNQSASSPNGSDGRQTHPGRAQPTPGWRTSVPRAPALGRWPRGWLPRCSWSVPGSAPCAVGWLAAPSPAHPFPDRPDLQHAPHSSASTAASTWRRASSGSGAPCTRATSPRQDRQEPRDRRVER
jgi:hypothetical protein